MTPGELHSATDSVRLEYYELVLDALKRYVRDGRPFSLETNTDDSARTTIMFTFDGRALSPYTEHLDGSQDGLLQAGAESPRVGSPCPGAIRTAIHHPSMKATVAVR